MLLQKQQLSTDNLQHSLYYEQKAHTHIHMMRTLRLEPNNLQISISAKEAISEQADTETKHHQEHSSDLDFFQTYPLGPGFELDCWEKKTSTEQKETIESRGSFSLDDEDPDGFDWTESDSIYSVEEQDSSSISDSDDNDAENEEDDDKVPTATSPGNSLCRPSDMQVPKQEILIGISNSVQILQPLFQAAVDHISTRHVHFGAAVVTAKYTYEKPSADDFFRLYYSAHELQRLQDQCKIDLCSAAKNSNSSDHQTRGVLEEQLDGGEDEVKQVAPNPTSVDD